MPLCGGLLDEVAHDVVGVVGVADGVGRRAAASGTGCWASPRAAAPGAPTGLPSGSAWRRRRWRRPSIRARTAAAAGARSAARSATMSAVRMRVANSDWCASRIVVSVSSTCGCSRIHSANFSGAELLEAVARARRRRRGRSALRRHAACDSGSCGSGAALHLRVAVDDHVADEAQQARRAVAALARKRNSSGVCVDEARRAFAAREQRMRDHVSRGSAGWWPRRARGTRAARGPCARIASSGVGAQAVTLTSSES